MYSKTNNSVGENKEKFEQLNVKIKEVFSEI
jgi:hypothetical protein